MSKYLFLIPSLGSGGAERVMVTIANNLSEQNEIHLVTLTDGDCYYNLNTKVKRYSLKFNVNRKNSITTIASELKGFFAGILLLKKIIREIQPDTIMSFLVHTNAMLIVLRWLGIANARCVVSERADPFKRNVINRFFEKHCYKATDCVVCQSRAAASFFDSNTQKKVRIIRNPISADAIPERFQGARRKTIVGVGRLFPQKNFALLIDAFHDISKKYPDYTLEIYGEGYLRQDLQKRIQSYDLADKACLMGERKNVMHYISDCSVFVLSSDFEGFPNALIEAMASGLPVISTDFSPVGVASEIICEGNGIVVPPDDKESLVKAIETIILNEELQESMSINNRLLLEQLNEKRIVSEWEKALQN